MQATVLLGTLKSSGPSNTATLVEFLGEHFEQAGVQCKVIRLVNHRIQAGTCSDMGGGDQWPDILRQILDSDIIVFATPIWWNSPSSEIQRVIERLDELHDEIMAGKTPRLQGKAAGVVITGDSDGAQSVIATIANFCNAIGLALPPFASLSVLSEKLAKGKTSSRDELLAHFRQGYTDTAKRMVGQLVAAVRR
jgi:multimeric flavodoxin WrbA